MFEWTEEQRMIRDAVRQFVESEIAPRREEFEFGDTPPYDVLRKMYRTFGLDAMAREQFKRRLDRGEGGNLLGDSSGDVDPKARANQIAMPMIPIIELCRHSPGMVTALGVSVGLTAAAVSSKGTRAQQERWALDLLTLDKIGAWAITEPNSGSDAFGSMASTAKRDGDEYVINGSKTFITNGPYADTVVFICKLDEGNPPAERKILHFVLESGMEGFEQSKPLRKMGLHSSPTGQLFCTDVRVGKDRLLGETEEVKGGGREDAKATFSIERSGVAAMSLGMIERCIELCIDYA
ncbi:MAG: acyl-CoA/acyl-ACP dehydrogenase, partial [Acidimicrobiia bacterium]|nr:acyl-CoA/acyl-ACP dehydrogenase [Acidimicrobiia bacterium]